MDGVFLEEDIEKTTSRVVIYYWYIFEKDIRNPSARLVTYFLEYIFSKMMEN